MSLTWLSKPWRTSIQMATYFILLSLFVITFSVGMTAVARHFLGD